MNSTKTDTIDQIKPKSHLAEIDESYVQHFGHALSFSFCMFKTGFAVMVHGFFPELFKTTASETINKLHDCMVKNRQKLSK